MNIGSVPQAFKEYRKDLSVDPNEFVTNGEVLAWLVKKLSSEKTSSEEVHKKSLEALDKYFRETSPEDIQRDLDKVNQMFTSVPQSQWDVHRNHCCKTHYCKYGDEDCPVRLGLFEQTNVCEMNDDYPCLPEFPDSWESIIRRYTRETVYPDILIKIINDYYPPTKRDSL